METTILDVFQRLLPRGTTKSTVPSWDECPPWPPDIFAVAGTLLNLSGAYAAPRFSGFLERPKGRFDEKYRFRVETAAKVWMRQPQIPRFARRAWTVLVHNCHRPVNRPPASSRRDEDWWMAAMTLVSIADSASVGLGFIYEEGSRSWIQDFVIAAHREQLTLEYGKKNRLLPHIPVSHCFQVPPSEVCVQPKTTTAQVGCTLRSLTHHLALLPPSGEVDTFWFFERSEEPFKEQSLNLLLIPFPYIIDDDAFQRAGRQIPGANGFFDVRQSWLHTASGDVTGSDLADFIRSLIQQSGEQIHGVIFPEFALTEEIAAEASDNLASDPHLEFLVAGISYRQRPSVSLLRNAVYTASLEETPVISWVQSKHHRWKLTPGQNQAYNLENLLENNGVYWENIDISQREVAFWPVRSGAVAGVLICEDLARIDPVQTVFRAVGPTLVFALLMDGPQLERRWSGRAALSLADDPGCSVLSFNSVGLIRRDRRTKPGEPTAVALWKEPGDRPVEHLFLPQDSHAIVLKLKRELEEGWTLDGRGDKQTTVRLRWAGSQAVKLSTPPAWAAT